MKKLKNFIGNEWMAPKTDSWMNNFNPATQEVLNEIPKSGAQDVQLTVEHAKKAFEGWSKRTVTERANYLDRIADLIQDRFEEFCETESLDTGKPITLC